MNTLKKPLILHPFLFAVFPVLSLYVNNLRETSFDQTLRAGLVSLAAAVVLMLLFWLVGRTLQRTGLAVSLVLVLFFSFGHVYLILRVILPSDSLLTRANVVMALWAVLLILGVWWILRKIRRTRNLTQIVNVMSATALLACVFPLATHVFHNHQSGEIVIKHMPNLNITPGVTWTGEKPDIYYIILDGYGRGDTLQPFYGVDNSPFLSRLSKRGFIVAEGSNTNYWKTPLSLASSLNFHYLDDLIDLRPESTDLHPLSQLIHENAVQSFLKEQGYRTIAFSTGFEFSEVRNVDLYYPSLIPINPFEINLLTGSMAIFWVDWAIPIYHRQEILNQFHNLSEASKQSGPKFVFAHMVTPHPPFVFDKDGNPVAPMGGSDGNAYTGGVTHYLQGYSQQIQYTNRLLEVTIDTILANSSTPPVIILQGDHGPGAYLDWLSVDNSCIRERFPILNAYYLPGQDGTRIPENITPVNTFRMIFNLYFDTGLAYESNRNFAAHWELPYTLYEVTDRLDWCPVTEVK